MNDELKELAILKANRVFSSLNESAAKKLLSKFTEVKLLQDEILFLQGAPSESIYLLVTGKLMATLLTVTGETRNVGHIDPGETVGELGALSSEPRSLSVHALRDSTLLQLSAKDFLELCHEQPSVMFATLNPIIKRSKNILQLLSKEKRNEQIVLVVANKSVDPTEFAKKFKQVAEKFSSLLVITEADFPNKHVAVNDVDQHMNQILMGKHTAHKIIFIVNSFETPLGKHAVHGIDKLYVIGERNATIEIDKLILSKLVSKNLRYVPAPSFILLHPDGSNPPTNTGDWLQLTTFKLHHHVRMDNTKDFQRLLRFIRDKATGLVFSGGGTRGWGHLGVIKAVLESKVPIDMVGGTSVGALIAACFAIDQSYDNAVKRFHCIITNSAHTVGWRGLTWPAVSIFSGKNFTQALAKVFEPLQIENMWLPYFCVSCNLANNNEVVHTSGSLWEKNRASTSIPGLIPPMLIGGQIHFDGGLLNNLPVDIMRHYAGIKGKVIAVELNSFAPVHRTYDFPPILTFKKTLWAKLGSKLSLYKFPPFMDTFLRGLFVGSILKSKQNSLAANIFISLDLSKYRLLNINPHQADTLIQIGYKEGLKQIKKNGTESTSASELKT